MWNYGECRAPGLQQQEQSEEILSSGTEPTASVGEEEQQLDLEALYDELEAWKQRLWQLRSKLVVSPKQPCEAQAALEDTDESFLTIESRQLVALRRQNCVLRCQLQSMAAHLKDSRKELKEMDAWRCLLTTRIQRLRKELDVFGEFQLRAIHHFGLCIERWEQHKACKVENNVYRRRMRELIQHIDGSRVQLVPMHCHRQTSQHLRSEIVQTRIFLHNLYESMLAHLRFFHRQFSVKTHVVPPDTHTSFVSNSPSSPANSLRSEFRDSSDF
ncbi:uncharacterized protein LOC117578461 [Drosophila guanche]|uniref:Uncharacterized protein n=1 Tax=Drosophila guanche TaxID=7266 RepID=A0A3B0J299_DROGU|nr:uncharacterized protein LOC117578461 [Drosophila guanche]SPP73093.1 Hypothetical predicted protein [Drosophila guanche]